MCPVCKCCSEIEVGGKKHCECCHLLLEHDDEVRNEVADDSYNYGDYPADFDGTD